MYALPMKGTHAHLFVMAYEHQDEAFRAYVDGMPGNATLLVDTYNTLDGVRDAIAVGLEMRARGQHLHGIRLDSGDLAWLSQRARAMLNDAGFVNTKIIASNDLDEHLIESLGHQGAEIDIFGVGTNLVTASDQPALGGVYKLGAMDLDGSGVMKDRIKASEDLIKTSIPGAQNVRRYTMDGRMVCDAIYDRQVGISDTACVIVDPMDPTKTRHPGVGSVGDDLLIPMMLHGRLTRRVNPYDLDAARKRCEAQTALLDPTIQRLQNPHSYPVGIEERLAQRRLALVQEIRRANHSA
jgi:nicotinate phosphoribosyltransferase